MKKIFFSMLVASMTAFTFTSCEDVPAAYEIPGGGNGGNGGSTTEVPTLYSETFDNNTTAFEFKDVNLTGGLTRVWKVASYNNNGYLNASAFLNNASHASESWAVSPAISLVDSKKAVLAFSHAINKLSDTSTMKDMMTVWASTDYTGDVSAATWKQLVVPNYPAGTSWSFVESGDIDLTEYCGKKVYIGFKYTSTDNNSGGWEVDNFTIKGDGTPMVTPDKPDTPDTPGASKGTGTKDDPFNSVAANAEASKLAANAVSEQGYYIKGKVVSVKEAFSAQFGNASFYISDDGKADGQFLVFRSLYLGNQKWTEGQPNIAEGDEVVVYGKLTNYYGNTPETAQGTTYLVSVNGKTEGGSTGGEDKPGEDKPAGNGNIAINGTTLTLSNPSVQAGATTVEVVPGDFYTENGAEVTTITLKDGTKIVFDANGEKNGPKYYTGANYSNIRVYKNNTITFEGHKAIAKVVFSCDVDKNKNVNCVGNETATVVIDGKTMTYTNVFKEASGGGVQLRINKIVITYAK